MTRSTRSLISLFSGAGGLDLGLERAKFETRVMVEIDRDARATVQQNRHHFGNRKFPILDDVTKVDPEAILAAAGLERRQAALVAGGPPCQSFSTAGRRGSIGDPRGSLFINFANMVEVAQPRFFVMENVRGLLSAAIEHRPLDRRGRDHAPLRPEEEQGSALRVILEVFDRLGYQVIKPGLVNAADYGVPQTRERLLILGSRDGEFPDVQGPREIVVPTVNSKAERKTLRDAFAGLTPAAKRKPVYQSYSPSRAAFYELIPPGANWRHIREHHPELLAEAMGGALHADGGRVGFYRRLSLNDPAPTLPTSPIQKSTGLCHPKHLRPLSVQEYAAIQQFPPDFEFAGSVASQYRQIGNAVPVGLGKAIGDALLDTMGRRRRQNQQEHQIRLLEKSGRYRTRA